MTTHELLELASLDALGLLDEHERDAFDRAFMAAPPALQAQIRREQARLARAEALLPDVEAPAGLRARVLAAVRDAITAVNTRGDGRRILPMLLPSRGVTPIWRAAAVGSIAAAIVFGLTTLHMRSEVDRINAIISANIQTDNWVKDFGARFEQMLFDPATQVVQFQPASLPTTPSAGRPAAGAPGALVMVDMDGTAVFLSKNLPEAPLGYAVVPVKADGTLGEPVLTFNTTGGAKHNDRIPNFAAAIAGGKGVAVIPQSRSGTLSLSDAVLQSKSS